MSERAFRVFLVAVFVIWVAFVLVPSVIENVPRAWAALQYFLPGSNPLVQVTVKDYGNNGPLADVRVQIIMDSLTLTGSTGADGTVTFVGVPSGLAKQIRLQKTDWDIIEIDNFNIPHRQRARSSFILTYDGGHRLYVGHDAGSGNISITLFDTASRQPLSPPGLGSAWENIRASQIVVNDISQNVFALSTNRLTVISTTSRGIVRQLALHEPARAMAVSPNGDIVYLVIDSSVQLSANTSTPLRFMLALDTDLFATRFQSQLDVATGNPIIIASRDGSTVYVAGVGAQTVGSYSTTGTGRVGTYQAGEPIKDMALSDDSRTLYVLTEHRLVSFRADQPTTSRREVLETDEAETVAAATRLLYAENNGKIWLCLLKPALPQVTLLNLGIAGANVYTVALAHEPSDIAHVRNSDEIYLANGADSSLSVVSLSKHTLLESIDVRSRPVMLSTQ